MCIFTIRYSTNIAIRLNIRFRILSIGRGLAAKGSYDRDINKPLLRITGIGTYNNSS